MTHTPHELNDAFPGEGATIRALKAQDPHFAKLAEEHHALNRAIHRAETDVEPMSDTVLEDMKKRRLALLDEISARLRDGAKV